MRVYDEYHKYGLVKIGPTQYEKCSDDCCKSGGPAFGKEEEE